RSASRSAWSVAADARPGDLQARRSAASPLKVTASACAPPARSREGRPPRQRPAWLQFGPCYYFIICNDEVSIQIIVSKGDGRHFTRDGEEELARNPKEGASMARFSTPASIEASPPASRPLLEAVQKQFGVVPNIFRLIGNSPAALEGLLGLQGGLGKGAL